MIITTKRLVLRKLAPSDTEQFFAYRSLPEVYKYQNFVPKKVDDALIFIEKLARQINIADSWFQFAICHVADGKLIGDIGVHFLIDSEQVEIGYTLTPSYQRCGYAREAVGALIAWLLGDARKSVIQAWVEKGNSPSIRLLRRLGMKYEREEMDDGIVYILYSLRFNDGMNVDSTN